MTQFNTVRDSEFMAYMKESTKGALAMRQAMLKARGAVKRSEGASDYTILIAGLQAGVAHYRAMLAAGASRAELNGAHNEWTMDARPLKYRYSVRLGTYYRAK